MGLRWRLRVVLYYNIPMLKRFWATKKLSSQNRSPKWWFCGNLRVSVSSIVIGTPKRHFLIRNDVFWRILRKNPSRGVGCSLIEEPKKRTYSHPKSTEKSRISGAETPEPIATKFCMPGATQDIIMPANFCEDRLRGFGVARGRILAFSIDLLRRL